MIFLKKIILAEKKLPECKSSTIQTSDVIPDPKNLINLYPLNKYGILKHKPSLVFACIICLKKMVPRKNNLWNFIKLNHISSNQNFWKKSNSTIIFCLKNEWSDNQTNNLNWILFLNGH